MPNDFAQRIIKAAERELDILPIVKCWVRFLHCPVYSPAKAQKFANYISAEYTSAEQVKWLQQNRGLSEVMAIEFSTTTQVSMTIEGLIVGYKVSTEITNSSNKRLIPSKPKLTIDEQTGLVKYDNSEYAEDRVFEPVHMGQGGDPFYCGDYLGHIIKVGQSHRLQSWKHINTNDNQSSVPGLHVGGLKYIEGYQNGSRSITHNILIDPMHVGAVVGTGVGLDGAMRVVQYFVLSAFNGVNKSLYNSSTYAAMTDKEYRRMIKDVVGKDMKNLPPIETSSEN